MKLFVDIPNYEGKYKINFDSIKEAVNNTGFQKGYIIACCKGKKELYKKYKWKYETI